MKIERAAIPDVLLITPSKYGDARGFFSETFRADALEAWGVTHGWAQDNHAFSSAVGVLRGLHFQAPPHAQAKLIRVARGAILDVVVDLRVGSPTYGGVVTQALSAENWMQLYAPAGFAHGYCTLTPETDVLYKASHAYAPASEGGVLWNDPDLAVQWPVAPEQASLSPRDRIWPRLRDLQSPFRY